MRRLLILLFLSISVGGFSQKIPAKPSPARMVNDFASVFSATQVAQLEQILVEFEKSTSNQIVVVTVKELGDAVPGDYTLAIMREWGVGQKAKDNGVVLLIKPSGATKGELDIRVGYGLEGALPDSRVGRIMDREMIPSLRTGDYFTAVEKGTKAIMESIRGEYSAEPTQEELIGGILPAVILLGLFFLIAVISSRRNKNGGSSDSGSGSSGGGMGIPPIFWGGMGGGRRGGGFGGSGGGFGGFGGGSGGGGGGGRSF